MLFKDRYYRGLNRKDLVDGHFPEEIHIHNLLPSVPLSIILCETAHNNLPNFVRQVLVKQRHLTLINNELKRLPKIPTLKRIPLMEDFIHKYTKRPNISLLIGLIYEFHVTFVFLN